nr:MAG TPA: ssDNA binding protein [Caudoviricetes sp.]
MLSKKELFNAKASSQKIEKGLQIDVVNVGAYDDTDKDGNPVTVSVLVDKDGVVFTSISKTVNDMLDMLEDIILDDGHALIEVCENTSNNGRKFFQLMLL